MKMPHLWRLSLLATTCLMSATPLSRASTFDLRCYGKLNVEERLQNGSPSIKITTANADAAKLVYSKFISDFTTLPTIQGEHRAVGGVTVKVLAFDSGRRLLPVWRKGEAFVNVYAFESEKQLAEFLKSDAGAIKDAVTLEERAHPLYMDLWDRRNMGFWYSPGFKSITKDRTDDQDFDFLRPRLLNVNTVGSGVAVVASRAARDDLGYKTNLWFDDSNYAYDANPEAINLGDPDTTIQSNYYGDVPWSDNPIRQAQSADFLFTLGQFTEDEHLMTMTDPHGETFAHTWGAYFGASNRDKSSRLDFVYYLRDLRKLTLPELGQRWYGDSARFKSWDDVQFPRERDFYGWKEGASQSLSGTWRWRMVKREDGEKEQFFSPSFDDSKWYAYQQPGTEYLAGDNENGGWMRHTFTPDAALLRPGAPLYLTICPFNFAPYKNPSTVYLNGKKIADLTFGAGAEWGQVEVRSLLKPGENSLTVYTRYGNILGPVFLTAKKAEIGFPTGDPQLNARKFDINEWIGDSAARAVARSVKRLRGIDPVRGIKLMAPHENVDTIMPYMVEWGLYPHCTGEGSYFRPWLPRISYLNGIMASSEPDASAADLKGLKRIFFTLTMEGTGAHDYFYNLHDVLIDPAKKDWYEKNLGYYNLNGKFALRKPEVAIAWSLRADRYGVVNGSAYQNDPGRGDLQQAHYGYLYCSEKDLMEGRMADYKVIVDDNFHTLAAEEVDVMEAWVRKGGMLVLNQRSGRNTILEPNAWPIQKLTQCVATVRPQEGTVTFEKNPSILKAYAGKTVKNYGESVDYQNRNYFTDSISLEPISDDIEVLARYDDGKPAIAVRTIGAGKVVILGSAFYRKTSDVKGFWVGSRDQTAFYKALLSDLGVRPLIESAQETLWAERFISNNGSTEMLVLGNPHDTEILENGEAVWDAGFVPHRVFDPATGKDVPVKIDGTKVRISNLTIPPYEMRYFAVERMDVAAKDDVTHWLNRQAQLWRAVPEAEAPAKVKPFWPIFLNGQFQVRQLDSETEARNAMALDAPLDANWKSMRAADWASAGLKQGPGLWAVYRKAFEVTPAWLADLRGAEFVRSHYSIRSLWKNVRDISLNGVSISVNEKVETPEKILAALKPGQNLLVVLTASGPDGNGGFYGEMGFRRMPGASGEIMELNKGWIAYPSEIDPQPIDLPKSGSWLWAQKQVVIPEKYKNHDVWIEIDGSAMLVSTNGQLRYASNTYGAKFSPKPLLVNITPDIRFGETNEIVTGNAVKFSSKVGSVNLKSAKLIFIARPRLSGENEGRP